MVDALSGEPAVFRGGIALYSCTTRRGVFSVIVHAYRVSRYNYLQHSPFVPGTHVVRKRYRLYRAFFFRLGTNLRNLLTAGAFVFYVTSLPVVHCQVLGDEPVLSDMRRATAQNQAVVEHQTRQDTGAARLQDRARSVRQGNGPQELAQGGVVPVAGRPRQSRIAVPRGRLRQVIIVTILCDSP